MKTISIIILSMLSTFSYAGSYHPYIGAAFGAATAHNGFDNQTDYSGISVGIRKHWYGKQSIRAELLFTESQTIPSLGWVYALDHATTTFGFGLNRTKGIKTFPAPFGQDSDTDKHTFAFAEVEYKNFYLRYSIYKIDMNFNDAITSNKHSKNSDDSHGNKLIPIAETISSTEGMVHVGYRIYF